MENEEAVFKVGEDEKPVTIEINQDGSEAKEEGGTPSLEVSVDEAPKKEVQQEIRMICKQNITAYIIMYWRRKSINYLHESKRLFINKTSAQQQIL